MAAGHIQYLLRFLHELLRAQPVHEQARCVLLKAPLLHSIAFPHLLRPSLTFARRPSPSPTFSRLRSAAWRVRGDLGGRQRERCVALPPSANGP